MQTQQRLAELKEADQDFEWYPTTAGMIEVVARHCGKISSILDIGAGDGRVLEAIDKLNFARWIRDKENQDFFSTVDKYAIEKSAIHIKKMPPDISIVGTDYMLQTLIDKQVDVVFCNPPYSEYESWAAKTIKEANAKSIFLILPQRWIHSQLIKQAIKQRGADGRVIWSGDFTDADRQARATVEIVKIRIMNADNSYGRKDTDPFDVWFDEHFSDFDGIRPLDDDEDDDDKTPDPIKEVVRGQNLIERLHNLYMAEMTKILTNYKGLSELDNILLKELGVSVGEIKKALKLKIKGLKNRYWKGLFDNLDKINSRLTTKSRETMLQKLNSCCNIDFTTDNAYAVVIWVIKNANRYIDQQLVEVFKELSEPKCVKNYKSNLKTWEQDRWRYKRGDHTRYTLEYRIVTQRHQAIKTVDSRWSWDWPENLNKNCHNFINDIFTIANNLGFTNNENSHNEGWESNQKAVFKTAKGKTLIEIRAFMNGNLHLKFDQNFIKSLNIEASRLLGWIKTPQEAADEMGLTLAYVKTHFKTNLLFGVLEGQKLLTA